MLRKQPDAYGVSIYEELEKRLKSGARSISRAPKRRPALWHVIDCPSAAAFASSRSRSFSSSSRARLRATVRRTLRGGCSRYLVSREKPRTSRSFGSNSEVSLLARHVRCTLKSRRRQAALACPLGADIVAKVFLGWRTKILRAADALYARQREGPYRFIQNRSRTSAVTLKSDAAAEKFKDQLSRDFPGRSIFDFCNNIGQ